MDIVNLVNLICAEMQPDLTGNQLIKLENTLYKHFRHLSVIEHCTDLEIAPLGGDVGLVRLFISTKRLAGRAESTLEQYNLEIWVSRTCIGKSFKDTTTMDLKMYLAKMQERGLSPVTLNNKRRYLNSFYGWLHKEGVISQNPVERIDSITEPQRHKKAYSVADIERMRIACTHPRDRAVFEFLLSSGLRVSELTSLKVKDIDFNRRRFEVIGKGNKQRMAFFDELTEFHLMNYFEWRTTHEGKTFIELQNEALFASEKFPYEGIAQNGVRSLLKRIANDAGVENVHPHRFRRTFATTALHRHMPIDKVQGVLGHVKVETTLLYIDQQNDLEQSYRSYLA